MDASIFPSYDILLLSILLNNQIGSAQIPVAVVESKIGVADFRQVAPVCVTNLTTLQVTDVFKTKRR